MRKMANLYQEIRYPLGEASDRMVTVSVFQSRVRLHIRQFYRDYYGKLRAGKTGITISVEEFEELTKLIPKLQQDVSNMNFKLLEDEKPEVVFPGDLDVTIIPSPPSPLTLAVDTDLNHEMLTPNWKDSQIIDTIPVQLEKQILNHNHRKDGRTRMTMLVKRRKRLERPARLHRRMRKRRKTREMERKRRSMSNGSV